MSGVVLPHQRHMKVTNRSVATVDRRPVRPREKVAVPEYTTPEHRTWARGVKERAGWKCEDCGKGGMLYADHVIEIQDGGARLDPRNGRAVCPSCHGLKSAAERAKRAAESLVRT